MKNVNFNISFHKTIFIFLMLFVFNSFSQNSIVSNNNEIKTYFKEAYINYPNLPKGILEAISFTTTRLNHRTPNESVVNCSGTPNIYGIMGIISEKQSVFNVDLNTISLVSGISIDELKESPKKNIFGVASWLNFNLVNKNHKLIDFIPLLANYTGIPNNSNVSSFLRNDFALQVFKKMRDGIIFNGFVFTSPQALIIADYFDKNFLSQYKNNKLIVSVNKTDNLDNKTPNSSDYIDATWIGSDCFNDRTTSITDVAIHDMEGYFNYTAYTLFQNCSNNVSSHYCIRSSDGFIVQLISEDKKAWHIGAGNNYSIGIEHEGFANDASWYTEEMYQSSAALVVDITQSGYGIDPTTCYNGPSNVNGQIEPLPTNIKIKGHCHYSFSTHYDPGENWNWYHYYDLINNNALLIDNNNLQNNIKLYPNPTNNILFISNPNDLLINKIEVYSILGSKISEINKINKSVNLSYLNAGIYIVKLYKNDNVLGVYKIIKGANN